jgi:ABC-type oligopeptide transport system substrate-binding subunit
VYRYEGTLARLMGDAVLAFFGAPIAHEDDPERACRAALEITAEAAEYAERLEKERGIKGFNVRVGINTGLVVVGEVGSDLRVEYTAMGDAINLAARMESAAEPGTVLITEDTHKLVAPLFETETLGSIQVKGRTDPVCVFRVLSAKEVPGKVRGIAGLESPLVGREAEFAALGEALERVEAAVGGIVTIVGEAGIGKSRLAAELRREASAGVQWVEGRCLSYGTSIAYLLWLDVLRGLLGVTLEESPRAVRETLRQRVQDLCPGEFEDVYPYLARLMSLRPAEGVEGLPLEQDLVAKLDDMGGLELKTSTFQAIETLIHCAASERPLVLVSEDLHWADPTSIELLKQVLPLTDRAPILFICVFRPEKEHGSWRIRETVARTYGYRHTDLWLQPLSAADSETLVGELLQIEALPPELKERILDVVEGNPFYVEEVIRSLIDQGAIVQDEARGHWTATREVAEIPIPDTLQGVLTARIDRLQEEAKGVLQMASVIGRIFLYRILEAIAEEERQLDAHLLTLQREEMIRERARIPELEYIFKHDLTREAAYNGLLKKKRRLFHRQVAEALERLFPGRIEQQLGLLAHHWDRAGDPEKATAYLLRAGDQARLLCAHQEAIDYYQRALASLRERREYELAARTSMKLGLTYHMAFDFRRSRQAYEEGSDLWRRAQELRPRVSVLPAPHALRLHTTTPPATLDPALACDTVSCGVVATLFSGLVDLTPELDVMPDLARSWEVLQDGRKYVFHLRDDVRWSDGTLVTAGDFEYAWKRVMDPATGSPNASMLYDVGGARAFHQGQVSDAGRVGVRALDELTLVLELEGPRGYLPQLLTHPSTYPVPRHVVQARGGAWTELRNIITNGPFQLQAWRREESMVLVRNPEYHGEFGGNLQQVELHFGADWASRLEMYQNDLVDVFDLRGLAAAEKDRARRRHAGDYISEPRLGVFSLAFDVTRPPFDDSRVRKAFALATDRETLANLVIGGYAFPGTGGVVPPGMGGHSAGIGLPCDPQQARQLLAQAGYPGGHGFPDVCLLVPSAPVVSVASKYLETQWRENLGIEVPWEAPEWLRYLDRLKAEPPHVSIRGWSPDYPDPDSFLRVAVRLHTHWRNGAYDQLVEEARQITDQGERMQLYQQADSILTQEAALVPLFYMRSHLLIKPWVSKYPTSPIRSWFWKDVIIEPH